MTGRLILWLAALWMAPLMCGLLANEAKFKKNIVVGVTLPYSARTDETVNRCLKRMRRQLLWCCLALLAVGGACVPLGSSNLNVSLWCLWVDVCIVAPYLPYVRCNRALKAYKKEKGWRQAQQAPAVTAVETSAISVGKPLRGWLFLPAVLLSLLPLVWSRTYWLSCVCFAVSAGIFWLCHRCLIGRQTDIVEDNAALTQVLSQVRRYQWNKLWLICAYSSVVFSWALAALEQSPATGAVAMIAATFAMVVAAIRIELTTRQVQAQLTAQSGQDWYYDQDDCWIGGVLYYNPRDPHTVVNNRVGINSTVNLAKPGGKALMGFVAVLLLALPFTGLFLQALGQQPISLELEHDQVVCANGMTDYQISFEQIEEITLLDQLPQGMSRTMGTGLENLLKGDFSSELGSLKVCLDPQCPPFLLIETQGRTYLLGCRDPELTRQIYEQLQEKIKTGEWETSAGLFVWIFLDYASMLRPNLA